jgi:excisionase family DNA binding protein
MSRAARPLEAVRRHAYTRQEAAQSLGMSVDTFERRVQPHIRVVPCGQLVLVPPAELERWVAENARHLVEEAA